MFTVYEYYFDPSERKDILVESFDRKPDAYFAAGRYAIVTTMSLGETIEEPRYQIHHGDYVVNGKNLPAWYVEDTKKRMDNLVAVFYVVEE